LIISTITLNCVTSLVGTTITVSFMSQQTVLLMYFNKVSNGSDSESTASSEMKVEINELSLSGGQRTFFEWTQETRSYHW
jgi:hypothetical protein